MKTTQQIRDEAERYAARQVGITGRQADRYPAMCGYMEGQIEDLVRQIEVLQNQLRDSNAEVARLRPVEEAARQLLDALYQRGRGPAAGPNTTLEIEDATEQLRQALTGEVPVPPEVDKQLREAG